MTTAMMRGYGITRAVAFIESDYFAPEVRQRLIDQVPRETRAIMPGIKAAEWYPRQHGMQLFRNIAAVKNNDDGSCQDLVACGKFLATEATNTFLKLFMKILTPGIFAKKLPELWLRDHRGSGEFEVDLLDTARGALKVRLVGVDGFDHCAPIGIGYLQFALSAMGLRDLEVKQTGWSMASPAPHEIVYEVTWKP